MDRASVRYPMAMRRTIIVDDWATDPHSHRGLELRAVPVRREVLVAGADVRVADIAADAGAGDMAGRDIVRQRGGRNGRGYRPGKHGGQGESRRGQKLQHWRSPVDVEQQSRDERIEGRAATRKFRSLSCRRTASRSSCGFKVHG